MAENEPKKSNYFPMVYYVANAASGGTDVEMSIAGEATAADVTRQEIPWAGSIVGYSLQVEAAVGAGTATFYPIINGVTAAAALTLDTTNTRHNSVAWRRGIYPFNAEDNIGSQYTTTATFTAGPTQSVVAVVWLHVEEN
jgi:hypothetical protein